MTTEAVKPAPSGPALPAPSAAEQESIRVARDRVSARRARATVKLEPGKEGDSIKLDAVHSDRAGMIAQLQDAFGSRGLAFASAELNHLVTASRLKDGQCDQTRLNALLAVVDGVRPANEIEAMLASQIAVTHRLAMDLVRRAHTAEQIPQFESAARIASKMMGAFTSQVDLLNRLQRGPAQTVRVEHVHVAPGAQAVVGHVTHTPAPGGGEREIGNQPHAPQLLSGGQPRSLTAEQGAALPSPDPERAPVPLAAGRREVALPHARRRPG